MKNKFGSEIWRTTKLGGFGYFIRYCDCPLNCKGKFYLSKDELLMLIKKTDVYLPLKEILWERFIRTVRIPKLSFVVEWRHIEELKKIPLAREDQILALHRSGLTQEQIGSKFGLTRQRICQILTQAKANRGLEKYA